MSFTSIVKDEVSRLDTSKLENLSELSAILRVAGTFNNTINITVENNTVARRIFKLIKSVYSISASITVRNKKLGRGFTYILTISENQKEILNDLSILENNKYLSIPKEYMVSDEEQIRAYLRGVFITAGSVNDPKTSRYHLEFVLDTKEFSEFINKLLNEYDLNSKIIKREKKYTVYIKEAEKISDFLRVIKAFSAVMYFEDIRIYRDHKNMVNRLNNCEIANQEKTFKAGLSQLDDINYLKREDIFDLLDDKTKIVASTRLKYPEVSFQGVVGIITNEMNYKIGKSGINHHFIKIKNLVNRHKESRNKK